jgi:hypothetical protein
MHVEMGDLRLDCDAMDTGGRLWRWHVRRDGVALDSSADRGVVMSSSFWARMEAEATAAEILEGKR